MDTEMFMNEPTVGGGWGWSSDAEKIKDLEAKDAPTVAKAKDIAVIKFLHSAKYIMRVALVLMVVVLLVQIIYGAVAADGMYKKLFKAGFSNKENLQWLGASTDVIRGDYENNQDSLAEKAMKADARVTDLSQPAKAAFTSRERMVSPEEELMMKQQQAAE